MTLAEPKARALSPKKNRQNELSLSATYVLQGSTQDHPGPRKKVPTAVSTTSSNRNQVMIQNDRGLRASQPRNPRVTCGAVCAASSMKAATIIVGTSATQTSKTVRKIQKAMTTTP